VPATERAGPALGIAEQSGADAARLCSLRDEKQLQVRRAVQGAGRDDPGESDHVRAIDRDLDQIAFSQPFAQARTCTVASYAVATQER
jgi:hypothetical protein